MPESCLEKLKKLNSEQVDPQKWLELLLLSTNIDELISAKNRADWGGDVHEFLSGTFIKLADQPDGEALINQIILESKLSAYLTEVFYLLTALGGQSYHILSVLAYVMPTNPTITDENMTVFLEQWDHVKALGELFSESDESKYLVRYESALIMMLALRKYLLDN